MQKNVGVEGSDNDLIDSAQSLVEARMAERNALANTS
jgi:hypothetical protein